MERLQRLFRRPALLSGLLIFIETICIGQIDQKYSDSLKNLLERTGITDSQRLVILDKIARKESDPDDLIHYGNQLLALSEALSVPKSQQMAELYIGNGYKYKGDLGRAMEHFFRSTELAIIANDQDALGETYGSIGNLHRQSKNYPEALKYNQLSLEIFIEIQKPLKIAVTYFNLGNIYDQMGLLDSAINCYNLTSEYAKSSDHRVLNAYSLGNMALVKIKKRNFSDAEEDLKYVFKELEQVGDKYGLADYLWQVSQLYEGQGNIKLAIEKCQESLRIAHELGLKEQIRDASFKLYELYKAENQFRNALEYHEQYLVYKDSITNMESVQEMANLRTEFEVGQKQAEVDLLTAEKKIQQLMLFAAIGFSLIVIILAAIIYKYYRDKNKVARILQLQKAELERLNHTKDKFFSIISHDLRGPVASFFGISRMIKFLVKSKETDQLLEIADDIDQSVERLSSLLDNLLNWAMQQQGHVPNVPEKLEFKYLALDLAATFQILADSKKITLQLEVEESTQIWADRNMTMTIFRNLINNALKFTPENGTVTLFATEKDGMVFGEVKDTGVGISKEKLQHLFTLGEKKSTYGTSGEKGLGLGLQLVHEFIELNNGEITVESEPGAGTVFTVKLPAFTTEMSTIVAS